VDMKFVFTKDKEQIMDWIIAELEFLILAGLALFLLIIK